MNRHKHQSGLSLVEVMVSLALFGLVVAGTVGAYFSFIETSSHATQVSHRILDVQLALKLLQRDLNMAGFGLPAATRVAGLDGGGETVTEAAVGLDIDGDGDAGDTVVSDVVYVADGWQIVKDITDNGAADGDIIESPTDYFAKLVHQREAGGYHAALTQDVDSGATALAVDRTDINLGEEAHADADFAAGDALILYAEEASGTAWYVEGHRLAAVSGDNLSLAAGDGVGRGYSAADSRIVPAIRWYIHQDTGEATPWLYRNGSRVLPGVVDFQVEYGYDRHHDGLEWSAQTPPAGSVDGADSGAAGNEAKIPLLEAVRVELAVAMGGASGVKTSGGGDARTLRRFETTVILKN